MSQLEKIIKLTKAQYNILSNSGTVGSLTGINDNYLYFITDETVSSNDLGEDFLLDVPHGGTGKDSFTIGSVLVGNGTAALTELAATDQNTPNTIIKRSSTGTFSTTAATIGSILIDNKKLEPVNQINSDGANMLLGYKKSGTGVNTSQWCVGTIDIQGVIRSSNTDLIHTRNGTNSTIIDTGNYKTYVWARPSSITTGEVLISSGTDGTTATRAILNNTSIGALGWNSAGAGNANNLRLLDVNTLAYWDGRYYTTNNASNLEYYKGGKFGTMAKETASDYAKLASPNLTGTPTAPTAENGTNTTQIATTAFVMNQFKYNDAMEYKGVVNSNNDLPADHTHGWTYKVATSGEYAGVQCEVGDMIICNTDGTSANNAHWNVIQTNIDGAVTSSSTDSVDNAIARFDGETGKIIQKSSVTIDDNGVLSISTNRGSNQSNLNITSSWESSSGYQWGINHLVPNITAGANTCLLTGVANTTGNQAVFGFHYNGSNDNGSYVDIGMYGKNGLLKVYSNGAVAIGGSSNSHKLYVNGSGYFTNLLTLYREGTTANNYPAGITFNNKDTTTGKTETAKIYQYNSHSTSGYGSHLFISTYSSIILAAGENGDTLQSAYFNTASNSNENLFLSADGNIFAYANANTSGNRVGFKIDSSGNIVPQKAEGINNNIQSLGASDNVWKNIYATTFTGNLEGNVTGDVTGNVTGDLSGNASTANSAITAVHSSAAHISTSSGTSSINSGWIKVKIKKKTSWMLSFTIRVYANYDYYDYVISGYNYGNNKWYLPKAVLLSSTNTNSKTVKFGYDDDAENNYRTLWVAVPAAIYYGVDIFHVTNGYTQVLTNINTLFEIVYEDSLSGTEQTDKEVTVTRPIYRNEGSDLLAIQTIGDNNSTGLLKKTGKNTWTLDNTAYTTNTGTVTSVQVQASSPLQSSSSNASSTTLNTTISFAAQAKNTILAGPLSSASANAAPTFRALEVDDIPDLKKYYVSVFNTSDVTNSTSTTFTQMAAAGNVVGMINAVTDNPEGSAKWVHAISLCWKKGTTSSWISQIALGVASKKGMWYRTTSGNIAGQAWYKILDSDNTSAASSSAVPVTCGTDATLATINGTAVKINVTKPSYNYSDIGNKPTSIKLTGAVTGSVTLASGENSISTTVNHTHDYAGSSSAGGAAINAVTTADTSNAIYPVGVKSGATSTLLHDTSITMKGGTINASALEIGTSGSYVNFTSSGLKLGNATATSNGANLLTVNGHILVEGSYNSSNSYSEGIRINRSSNGWSVIALGGTQNTTSGTGLGVWLVGAQATPNDATTAAASITDSKFYIAYNGSSSATCRITGHNATGFSIRPRLAVAGDVDTNYAFKVTGTSWLNGPLRIGSSDTAGTESGQNGYATANSGSKNYITFYGVYGDGPGNFNHTYIGESIYGPKDTANEKSELLLFKGNDINASSGPDRIRLFANEIDIQVYASTLSGSWDTIRQAAGTQVANFKKDTVTINGNVIPSGTRTLGTSSIKWDNVYATTFTGDLTGSATNVTGTVAIANGGTGGTTDLEAANNLGVPYIKLAGTSFTSGANIDTYTTPGTYYSPNSTSSSALTGTNPVTGSGYKMIVAAGYTGSRRTQIIQQNSSTIWYRYTDDGSTWQKWRKFVVLEAGSDNKTFSNVGSSTQPIYVNADGVVTTCTAYANAVVAEAGKATNDADGNAINTTYLKLSGGDMTGSINRYYSTSSNDAMIRASGSNKDFVLFAIGHGSSAGAISGNYYKLKYFGTGNSPDNYLQLISAVNSSTEVIAVQVNENGIVQLPSSIAASTVKGSSTLQVCNTGGNNVAIELRRGTLDSTTNSKASWQISVESGNLHVRNDYINDTQQTTYASDKIGIDYKTGSITMETTAADTAAKAILKLNSTTSIASTKYQWGVVHLANLAAGAATALATGKSDGTNNLAYFGFHYAGDGLNTNYAEIGFKGANDLVRVYPTGQVSITKNITSSSTSTGSLVVAGGTGIAGALYVGTTAQIGKIKIGTGTSQDYQKRTISTTDGYLLFSSPTGSGFVFQENAVNQCRVVKNTFYPETTNNGSIGISANRWGTVYAQTNNSAYYTINDNATSPVDKVTLQWNSTDNSLDFIFA